MVLLHSFDIFKQKLPHIIFRYRRYLDYIIPIWFDIAIKQLLDKVESTLQNIGCEFFFYQF